MFNVKLTKTAVVATLFLGFTGVATAQDTSPNPDQVAADAAQTKLSAIAANLDGVAAEIVAAHTAEMGGNSGWENELTAMLKDATTAQVLAAKNATSYAGVQAALQGRDAPVSADDLAGADALGDLTQDLVYTPVVPCRIFDTRFDTDPILPGGSPGYVSSYQVHGTAGQLVHQGHTAGTGCAAPKGEPVGISANFTVVPSGTGHIRVWPFTATQPNASFLNYQSGANLANAGIFATCFLCGDDISVSTWFGSSHSLADVMGYFYPAPIFDAIGMAELDSADLSSGSTNVSSGLLVAGSNYAMGPSFTPSASGKCIVNTNSQVSTDIADTFQFTFIRTARQVGLAAPVNDGTYGHYTQSLGTPYSSDTSASYVWSVTGGTSYRFGCYLGSGGDHVGDTAQCRVSWMCF